MPFTPLGLIRLPGPPAVLAIPVLVLGVYIPPPLSRALREIARTLGGS